MIAANMAAYFDKVDLRVLLIDYDYQGSLTDIVPYADPEQLTFSAHHILQGSKLIPKPHPLGLSFRSSQVHPAEADLSRIDSHLIYQWLTGIRKDDIRFNTRNYLSSAYVRTNFDVVIIDTPPRICAATANALCAASHVLMPTILDTVSSRAVLRSVEMFLDFRDKLELSFKMLGVVPSKVQQRGIYNNRESQALSYLKGELNGRYGRRVNRARGQYEPVKVLEGLPIMHKVALLHSEGEDLMIFDETPKPNDAIIMEMFSKLGNYVLSEIGIQDRQTPEGELHANRRVAQGVLELRGNARAHAG